MALIPLPGDPGFAQHTRRAFAAGLITAAERRQRNLLEWAVVRSRGIDDLRHCVDGQGHRFEPTLRFVDRHGRPWSGAHCTRCAVFTVILADAPERSTEAFLGVLAEHAEHRDEAA